MLNGQPAKPAGILSNRFVQLIVLSSVFLHTGIWVRNFAILMYVLEKTGQDAKAVSLISVAEYAPIFVFSLIGGTFADRWRPKRTMIWCDLLSATSVGAVLLAFLFASWKAIFFATLISAILSQFSQPSALKLFKQHVPPEQLQSGMAMFQTTMALFMIIGPMLGTFVYESFGIQTAIGVMTAAFLLSAGTLTFLPESEQTEKQKAGTSVWQELQEGLRYVWSRSVLRTMGGVYAAAGLGMGLLQPLGVFIVVERLGLPKDNLQWFLVTNGAAMLIGGVLVMGWAKSLSPQKLLAIGLLATGVSAVCIGLSTSLAFSLVMQFFNGLLFPCIHIGLNTLILKGTEEAYIGRVNGVLNPVFTGTMVVTMSLAGWLKNGFGLVPIYESAGLLFVVSMLLLIPLFKLKEGVTKQQETG
ncbi:MFS transporter [Paenibacillus sp. J31TS4]|uniref:MFS transporter n=1 Tax=Paenibacillus sp. J31TS4 TaxID=2807195 RepID=UPI001B0A80F1|nr:MFS transporter [Paenibacillus sp. J31TS4]GIP37103.1 MFS transporter [Paenibacillus sp. J31TS4]